MKSAAFLFIFFNLFTLALSDKDNENKKEPPHWSYEEFGGLGPSQWSKLSPDWHLCNYGLMQSPVDLHIHTEDVIDDDDKFIHSTNYVSKSNSYSNSNGNTPKKVIPYVREDRSLRPILFNYLVSNSTIFHKDTRQGQIQDQAQTQTDASNKQSPQSSQSSTLIKNNVSPVYDDVVNNGHTCQINYEPGSSITVNGKIYSLVQFHFHSPSEHTLNGRHYAMEMHLVHQNEKDNSKAVVAVFLTTPDLSNTNNLDITHLDIQSFNSLNTVESIESVPHNILTEINPNQDQNKNNNENSNNMDNNNNLPIGSDGLLHGPVKIHKNKKKYKSFNVRTHEDNTVQKGQDKEKAKDNDKQNDKELAHDNSNHNSNSNTNSNSAADESKLSPFELSLGENDFLNSLSWNDLPSLPNSFHPINNIIVNVFAALPFDLGYWHYTGSLTTPPCTEGVSWYVLKEPVMISEHQRLNFIKIFKRNARPTQPLHERNITATLSSPFADFVLYNINTPMVTEDAFISVVGGLVVVSVLLLFAVIFICTRATSASETFPYNFNYPLRSPRQLSSHAMPPDAYDLERNNSITHMNNISRHSSNASLLNGSNQNLNGLNYLSPLNQPLNESFSNSPGLNDFDYIDAAGRSSAPAVMGLTKSTSPPLNSNNNNPTPPSILNRAPNNNFMHHDEEKSSHNGAAVPLLQHETSLHLKQSNRYGAI